MKHVDNFEGQKQKSQGSVEAKTEMLIFGDDRKLKYKNLSGYR